MRAVLKWVGRLLLLAAVALCFAPTIVPPFLDRIYYRGPISDHYDGARFFNPGAAPVRAVNSRNFLNRMVSNERAPWPARVAVRPTVPPRRVSGGEMLVT